MSQSNVGIPAQDILEAREVLRNVVGHTPLSLNQGLSKKYGANIFLKREDLQVVRSFKIRGAYYKMSKLSEQERRKGIVYASAGNHAQGVAMACAKLGIDGIIFMPTPSPRQKVDRVIHFGEGRVEIRFSGDTFDDSKKTAEEFARREERPFIHPFDDRDVIAGQGTIAIEILEDAKEPIDFLIVSVGGGGLISGVSSYMKLESPNTKIIAVEAEGAASLHASLEAGKLVTLDEIDGFADGIATKRVGEITFEICKELVDQVIRVSEGRMCVEILNLYNEEAIVVEPSCASVTAALDNIKAEIRGKNVVCIMSGGNNDITRTEEIKERALLYEGKKHYFIINFPQRAGALREFLELLGPDDDIARFEYTKKTNRGSGPALVGLEFKNKGDFHSGIINMPIIVLIPYPYVITYNRISKLESDKVVAGCSTSDTFL